MLNDIIQDDKFPIFEQIINPYYKTNYQPKEIFPKPENEPENNEKENFNGKFQEATKKMETKYNQNEQQNNNNVKLEEIIDNNYKESFVIPNIDNNENEIEEDNNLKNIEEMKRNMINELNNNYNGNGLITVDDMINKNVQSNKKEENDLIQKNKENEEEYNDFLDTFLFI